MKAYKPIKFARKYPKIAKAKKSSRSKTFSTVSWFSEPSFPFKFLKTFTTLIYFAEREREIFYETEIVILSQKMKMLLGR